MIDPAAGSRNSIAEALTNIIWAPLNEKISGISLSANWMWPCKNIGEDARLYKAVEAASNFSIELGINIPTGKDSLSMNQKYNNKQVKSPGTVIISAAAHCTDINNLIAPVFKKKNGSIYYVNISSDNYFLGGSALGQIIGSIGKKCPSVKNPKFFVKTFNTIQELIGKKQIIASLFSNW